MSFAQQPALHVHQQSDIAEEMQHHFRQCLSHMEMTVARIKLSKQSIAAFFSVMSLRVAGARLLFSNSGNERSLVLVLAGVDACEILASTLSSEEDSVWPGLKDVCSVTNRRYNIQRDLAQWFGPRFDSDASTIRTESQMVQLVTFGRLTCGQVILEVEAACLLATLQQVYTLFNQFGVNVIADTCSKGSKTHLHARKCVIVGLGLPQIAPRLESALQALDQVASCRISPENGSCTHLLLQSSHSLLPAPARSRHRFDVLTRIEAEQGCPVIPSQCPNVLTMVACNRSPRSLKGMLKQLQHQDRRLLAFKHVPRLDSAQARQLSPFEVGTQAWKENAQIFSGQPATFVVLLGPQAQLRTVCETLIARWQGCEAVSTMLTLSLYFDEHEVVIPPQAFDPWLPVPKAADMARLHACMNVASVCLYNGATADLNKLFHSLKRSSLDIVGAVTCATASIPDMTEHQANLPEVAICLQVRGIDAVRQLQCVVKEHKQYHPDCFIFAATSYSQSVSMKLSLEAINKTSGTVKRSQPSTLVGAVLEQTVITLSEPASTSVVASAAETLHEAGYALIGLAADDTTIVFAVERPNAITCAEQHLPPAFLRGVKFLTERKEIDEVMVKQFPAILSTAIMIAR
eukprot:TRINITY_DN9257_c0_g1_i2.p1 TRINITY_DN9257_c0_g1~~TRINITY_DN9257_c0_g1_i2.p1  ORF type:complete len:632 (+),score=102.32 TRINITY_DN9257_c0_g1_i2:2-1897(+)